jgi:hypothetical protein
MERRNTDLYRNVGYRVVNTLPQFNQVIERVHTTAESYFLQPLEFSVVGKAFLHLLMLAHRFSETLISFLAVVLSETTAIQGAMSCHSALTRSKVP